MAKNKLKNIVYSVLFLGVVGGLFAWPIITDPNRPIVSAWKKAGIGCLGPGVQIGKHIHSNLSISVDGVNESFDMDLGIARGCMGEFHVHKGQAGVLHLETISAKKEFKLSDFFVVYGKPLMRDGYTLEATANGAPVADPANLILEDKQVIELKYTSVAAE